MTNVDDLARRFRLDQTAVRRVAERAADPYAARALDLVVRMARMGATMSYDAARAAIMQEVEAENEPSGD